MTGWIQVLLYVLSCAALGFWHARESRDYRKKSKAEMDKFLQDMKNIRNKR